MGKKHKCYDKASLNLIKKNQMQLMILAPSTVRTLLVDIYDSCGDPVYENGKRKKEEKQILGFVFGTSVMLNFIKMIHSQFIPLDIKVDGAYR